MSRSDTTLLYSMTRCNKADGTGLCCGAAGEPLLMMATSHVGLRICVLAALLPIQLHANDPGKKAENGPVRETHMEFLPSSSLTAPWLLLAPGKWTSRIKSLSSPSLALHLPTKIKKSLKRKPSHKGILKKGETGGEPEGEKFQRNISFRRVIKRHFKTTVWSWKQTCILRIAFTGFGKL